MVRICKLRNVLAEGVVVSGSIPTGGALARTCEFVNALRIAHLHIQSPNKFPFVGIKPGSLPFHPPTLRRSEVIHPPATSVRNFTEISGSPSTSLVPHFWALIAAKDPRNLGKYSSAGGVSAVGRKMRNT